MYIKKYMICKYSSETMKTFLFYFFSRPLTLKFTAITTQNNSKINYVQYGFNL